MKPKAQGAVERKPSYWLNLFSAKTWGEFRGAGASISGFNERQRGTATKIAVGDFLLCYMTGVSRWVGVLEITSPMFLDTTPLWQEEPYPVRFNIKPVIMLEPETGVPILDLKDALSYFRRGTSPNVWTGYFRRSPAPINEPDAQAILSALETAAANPVVRPVDPAKLRRPVKTFHAKIGDVTIPDAEPETDDHVESPAPEVTHEQIQCRLLRLGSDLGLDVWVARNDKNRVVSGIRLGDLPRVRTTLPTQFDEATNRTIELIDVLWLQKNSIVAAFEVEHTTAIYSGLLRMSDLQAMQPNLNIPLYIVAPDERRDKVIEEINRPTFKVLSSSLSKVCRFIPYSRLLKELERIGELSRHLKPDFLLSVSKSCDPNAPE